MAYPACHLARVAGPAGSGRFQASVWICEYPYRTMRLEGPSEECGECPVWQQLQRTRAAAAASPDQDADADTNRLPLMVG